MNIKKVLIMSAILMSANGVFGQGMAVNTSGTAADQSAMLDVNSTSKGVLVPRLTAAQKTAISSPATGLLIFQTDGTSGFYYYNGSVWTAISGGSLGTATTFSNGIPYTICSHSNTTTTFNLGSPIAGGACTNALTNALMYAVMPTACHAYLAVYCNNATTFTLLSSTAVGTAGSSIGNCTTTAGSCFIDGGSLSAGALLYIQESSNPANNTFTTAFSCQ